eukprot:CAMPEP_0169413438 /NCGR_PEP_ID=MMETSP1017-20121227/61353_1 /TAXON_ID=342587 /ORGANISM="Karlodinium micrum, Strain CCMP2283" /LENGTH=143 /DNA_ID=CAMNT_0009520847 /DNA_START=1201 /DNA_END=1632 /DNA_ORIENTATION=-
MATWTYFSNRLATSSPRFCISWMTFAGRSLTSASESSMSAFTHASLCFRMCRTSSVLFQNGFLSRLSLQRKRQTTSFSVIESKTSLWLLRCITAIRNSENISSHSLFQRLGSSSRFLNLSLVFSRRLALASSSLLAFLRITCK